MILKYLLSLFSHFNKTIIFESNVSATSFFLVFLWFRKMLSIFLSLSILFQWEILLSILKIELPYFICFLDFDSNFRHLSKNYSVTTFGLTSWFRCYYQICSYRHTSIQNKNNFSVFSSFLHITIPYSYFYFSFT